MLYEMLAGEPPYTGISAQAIIAKRFTDPVPSVRRLRDTIPPAVDAAISRALAKVPADRFGTAGEFGVALVAPATRTSSAIRRWAAIAAGFLLFGVAAYGLWARFASRDGASPELQRKMLVVLPLENLGAPEDEYFADGLSEALTTQLGSLRDLGVIARQSAMRYKGTTETPQAIGRELGVQYLLTGTVRWDKSSRSPSRVRVSTALVRSADASQLWAKQYDTLVAGVFGVESNLAERVARALGIALEPPERRALAVEPTQIFEAHELYLKGRFFAYKSSEPDSIELDLRRSLEYYRRAVAIDPHYALAWAGIAEVWLTLANDFVRPREAYPEARAAALKALSADSMLGEAHAWLGDTQLYYDWDFAAAREELQRAIALSPSAVGVYSSYADLVGVLGEADSAVSLLRQARTLDPLAPDVRLTLARWLVFAGQYNQAMEEAGAILDIDPRDAHASMGYALFGAGKLSEALREYQRDSVDLLAPVSARLGRREDAYRLIAHLVGRRSHRYVQADAIAGLYANLGERDAAFAWLDTAYQERAANMLFLSLGPILQPIRNDPRFRVLTRKVGLP
jgi:TolB-like protein/tetratricopeptide (TPR) repeat protein